MNINRIAVAILRLKPSPAMRPPASANEGLMPKPGMRSLSPASVDVMPKSTLPGSPISNAVATALVKSINRLRPPSPAIYHLKPTASVPGSLF